MEPQRSSGCVDGSLCPEEHHSLKMLESNVFSSLPCGDYAEQDRTNSDSHDVLKYLTSTKEFEKWPEIQATQFIHSGNAPSLQQCAESKADFCATSPNSKPLQMTSSSGSEHLSLASTAVPHASSALKNKNLAAGRIFYNRSVSKQLCQKEGNILIRKLKQVNVSIYETALRAEQDPQLIPLRTLALRVVTLERKIPCPWFLIKKASEFQNNKLTFRKMGLRGYFLFLDLTCLASTAEIIGWMTGRKKTASLALETILKPYLRVIPFGCKHWVLQASQEPFATDPAMTLADVNEKGLESSSSGIELHEDDEMVSYKVEVSSEVIEIPFHGDESCNRNDNVSNPRYLDWTDFEKHTIIIDKPYSTSYQIMLENGQMWDMKTVFSKDGPKTYCSILINDFEVAKANGKISNIAKKNAAAEALEKLKKVCWTIQRKTDWREVHGLCRSCFVGDFDKCTPLKSNNVGCQMLMKVGWKRRGIGGNEDGAKEPVPKMHPRLALCSRKLSKADAQFFIEFLSSSENCDDIVLSGDFTPGDIKILGKECGGDKNIKLQKEVFLVKTRTHAELLEYLKRNDGESCLYKLYPPGCHRETLIDDFSMEVCNPHYLVYTTLSESLDDFRERIAHIFESFANSMQLKYLRLQLNFSLEERSAVMELADKANLQVIIMDKTRMKYLKVKMNKQKKIKWTT